MREDGPDSMEQLYREVRDMILENVREKGIDREELTFRIGIDEATFDELMEKRHPDFSIYLRALDLVLTWDEHK